MKREVAVEPEILPGSDGEFPWSMPGINPDDCDHLAGAYAASLPCTGFFADTHDGEKSRFHYGEVGNARLSVLAPRQTHIINRRQKQWQ